MKISDLGQVIATRTYSAQDGEIVSVRIGTPFTPPGWEGNSICPYQILGLGNDKIRYAPGIDGVQALYLALKRIATDLYTSDQGRAGTLRFLGMRNLGLPVEEAISDLVPRE